MQRKQGCRGLAAALVTVSVAGQAHAAGYGIREVSASALGSAQAGAAAGADDISYQYFNPAALARHDGLQAIGVASYISPRADFRGGAASTAAGAPIVGGNGPDAGRNALVPALYGSWRAAPEWTLGIGVTAPYGLATDYDADWLGRYHAVESQLKSINAAPAVAWRPASWLSLGAGLQVQYLDAKLTNAVDFGAIGAAARVPGAVPGRQDGFAKVKGDDIAVGYTLGVIVEPWSGTRFGAGFRSRVEHELDGRADFSTGPSPVGAVVASATGRFVDTGARASTTTPETVFFGIHHDVTPRWSVMADAQWQRWSRFRELRIRFDNPLQADSVTEQHWHDTWYVAVGSSYRFESGWSVRAGVGYDESPVPDATRTPRVPDQDRVWLALGGGFEWEAGRVDFAYAHQFVDDPSIDLAASGTGNAFRGNLAGSFENEVNILSLQARFRF